MGIYADRILPPIIDRVLGTGEVAKHRSHVVPEAAGTVLELGFGTGPNLAHYRPEVVTEVLVVEPASGARRRAEARARDFPRPVRWIGLDGERIEADDGSVDSVVCAFTLCTIPDAGAALREAHRVLRPGGRIHYLEHGRHPDPRVLSRQRRIEPVWRRLAGGCRLTRDPHEMVLAAGFGAHEVRHHTLTGPSFSTYLYEGSAPRD